MIMIGDVWKLEPIVFINVISFSLVIVPFVISHTYSLLFFCFFITLCGLFNFIYYELKRFDRYTEHGLKIDIYMP